MAARAERLAFARKLRDTLHSALEKDKRYEVFLDVRGGLTAGDIWQDGLHSALRNCAAGVVLLTPESLESGWVLKEATILSWRVFQREPILLVPVVLGVTDDDLVEPRIRRPRARPDPVGARHRHRRRAVASAVTRIVAALRADSAQPLVADKVLPPTENG